MGSVGDSAILPNEWSPTRRHTPGFGRRAELEGSQSPAWLRLRSVRQREDRAEGGRVEIPQRRDGRLRAGSLNPINTLTSSQQPHLDRQQRGPHDLQPRWHGSGQGLEPERRIPTQDRARADPCQLDVRPARAQHDHHRRESQGRLRRPRVLVGVFGRRAARAAAARVAELQLLPPPDGRQPGHHRQRQHRAVELRRSVLRDGPDRRASAGRRRLAAVRHLSADAGGVLDSDAERSDVHRDAPRETRIRR